MEKDSNREVFETMPVMQALWVLAFPAVVGQLIVLIYNLADTFFIGRTNNPMMVAGASLILPVFNITVSLAGLTGIGGGALISRLLGVGKDREARKVCSFSFYFALIIAAVFSVTMGLLMNPILRTLGASSDTISFSSQYAFCVIVIGGIPTVLSMTMANLLRSIGCSKQASFGVSMGGIINIGLDPLFMFVILPDGMEIIGAGIATMLSNVISCIYFIIVVYRMRENAILSFSPKIGIPDGKKIRSIFTVGIPSALGMFLFDLDYVVIDKLTANYSDVALAAIGIVLKAERLPLNVGVGICQGVLAIIAYNYAAGNFDRMRKVTNYSRLVGLAVAAVSILIYEVFAGDILRLFIEDSETVRIGANFLRARCLATPFMFMSFHLLNMFQAVGGGATSMMLVMIRWLVFNIPILFIMNMVFGIYGIVWAQIIGDIFTVIVSFIMYYRFEVKVLKKMEKEYGGDKSPEPNK